MKHLFLAFLICLLSLPSLAEDKLLDIKEITSDSGLTAWLVEDHTIPVIALHFAFKGAGSAGETEETQGLARLASNTMDEGAGKFDSKAFQSELRKHVITLSFRSSRDSFGGVVKTRTSTKGFATELLRMALTEPRFDEEAVQRMKQANIARIKSSLSDPEWIAARFSNDRMFEGHPYALNSGGTISSLQNLTSEDLKNFVQTRLAKNNLKLAIVGDINEDEAKSMIERIFQDLPETASSPDVEDFEIQNPSTIAVFESDIPQTIVQAAQPALPRDHPDYYAYQTMNQILGAGGFGSRLTKEIREKRGLTYGVYTGAQFMEHTNLLFLSLSTANKNAAETLNLAKTEMSRLRSEPVSQEERDNAVSYINGSLPLALSSTSSIASLILNMQLDALPINYLDERASKFESVTIEDIQRVAQERLNPENMTTIMVGKPEGLDENNVTQLTSLPNVE